MGKRQRNSSVARSSQARGDALAIISNVCGTGQSARRSRFLRSVHNSHHRDPANRAVCAPYHASPLATGTFLCTPPHCTTCPPMPAPLSYHDAFSGYLSPRAACMHNTPHRHTLPTELRGKVE